MPPQIELSLRASPAELQPKVGHGTGTERDGHHPKIGIVKRGEPALDLSELGETSSAEVGARWGHERNAEVVAAAGLGRFPRGPGRGIRNDACPQKVRPQICQGRGTAASLAGRERCTKHRREGLQCLTDLHANLWVEVTVQSIDVAQENSLGRQAQGADQGPAVHGRKREDSVDLFVSGRDNRVGVVRLVRVCVRLIGLCPSSSTPIKPQAVGLVTPQQARRVVVGRTTRLTYRGPSCARSGRLGTWRRRRWRGLVPKTT